MRDSLSTRELGWVLARSEPSIRDDIRSGDIEATRIPQGFRIARTEVLRLARDKAKTETDRTLPDEALERLIDQVIETNEGAL